MSAVAPSHSSSRTRRRAAVALALGLALAAGAAAAAAGGLLDRSYRPLAGKQPVELSKTYAGDVVLVVNTASKCGFTPQFEALEGLHAKYKARGFAVLGFPSGDFKAQEFEDEKQIQEFCTLTYGVKFPMFEKVHVVGEQATPLYKDLAKAAGGEAPKWNFHKYLIGRDGKLIASYGSKTTPDDPAVVAAIERALAAPAPKAAAAR
ncbi:glutathione peroxidase/vitamin B12 transport periplasmic protein btuE [Lysobacter enzymogenes]|uniref:Glutathione peroxidase n=1 Tax=Lysobacter enzymogenes TaxID=69 RepID=A0A0S2DHA5_LYSEN|nr:glutathione peroxidase [Lysobacter enzymogenes]ALN58054.1 glutathione peroxidase/vitamin B12 transport periplasmic protein btuE [Lysobacter enzymogenes]QCW26534.1 glutathione peroxidase [Lysobacter enzymogenes]